MDHNIMDNQLLSGLLDTNPLLDLNIFPVLALSLIPIENVEGGIFTRITMTSMTSQWYLRLSHFEAILVGLVVLQVFVMRYFLILPLDITKLIEDGTLLATSVSRKKRRAHIGTGRDVIEQQRLTESMFSILRRLDEDDCFLRTLCELAHDSNHYEVKSGGIQNLIANLRRLGLKRIKFEKESPYNNNNVTMLERKVIAEFEDAVLLGSGYWTPSDINNITTCEQSPENICANHYSLCTVDTRELLAYVNNMLPFLS